MRPIWLAQINEDYVLTVHELSVQLVEGECDLFRLDHPQTSGKYLGTPWVHLLAGELPFPYGWTQEAAIQILQDHLLRQLVEHEDRLKSLRRDLAALEAGFHSPTKEPRP